MNQNCEMVQDLLPLYLDEVCSDASRDFVGKHLENCPECNAVFMQMCGLNMIERLTEEREGVISHQARATRSKSFKAGMILAAIFLLPIFICLIVNLAVSHTLSWFFFVPVSIMPVAAVTLIPLMVRENRFFMTTSVCVGSVLLLLAVCAGLTGGGWFGIAASALLLGTAVFFLPFLVRRSPLRERLGNHKLLFVLGVDTLLFYLMFFCIAISIGASKHWWNVVLSISLPIWAFIWGIFLVVRSVRGSGWMKAAFLVAYLGGFSIVVVNLIRHLLNVEIMMPQFVLTLSGGKEIRGDLSLLFAVGCVVIGVFLLVPAFMKSRKGK